MSQRHWFEDLADHMGEAYLRYSFTRGTVREVDLLVDLLGLSVGSRVLDVGCGPGRHVAELASRGMVATGLDIAERFIELGNASADPGATFVVGDARNMDFDSCFEGVISLCQGGFGLGGPGPFAGDPHNVESDRSVLRGIRDALVPGGHCAVSAFSSYFQVRWLEPGDTFDAATAVNHERTDIADPEGVVAEVDLWTTCYTPRELELLARSSGLDVLDIFSVAPGDYVARPPDLDHQEFLMIARRPPV